MARRYPGKDPTPVLFVEDNPVFRSMLVYLLRRRFACVHVAKDGLEGLELFQLHKPVLVITDILMPRLDGLAMARSMKEQIPGTQIIFLTGVTSDTQALLSAIAVGVSDYVLKPVDPERLHAAIDKCLRLYSLERTLLESNAQTENILESLGDAFLALDQDWQATHVNRKAGEMLGKSREQLLSSAFQDHFPDPLCALNRAVKDAMRTQKATSLDHFMESTATFYDVNVYPLGGGLSIHFRDITERKQAEEARRFLVYHDELTELPNRAFLHDNLNQAIARSRRSGKGGAVLFLDLDRFKKINDSFGHQAGDRLLQEVARRLRSCLRESETIARLGGDEFVILVEAYEGTADLIEVTNRILLALSQDLVVEGLHLNITASIGISLFPGDGLSVDTLLNAADAAMYQGKDKGRNTFQFYHADMNAHSQRMLLLESELRMAIQNGGLTIHYQPQFNLRSGQLVGFEALLRWRHPERGMISPLEFIPLAEETGLIIPIGEWLLDTACRQARIWLDRYGEPLSLAVNVSRRQFWQGDLIGSVDRALIASGLPPQLLELEITESMVMNDFEAAIVKMQEFQDRGLKLSIDDFGTGFSSLSCLKRFPLHALKVDQSFVQDVTTKSNDAAISVAIVALARALHFSIVVEGIETREQLAFFQALDCDSGQGFLLSPPVLAEQVDAWITKRQNSLLMHNLAPIQTARSSDQATLKMA